MPRLQYERLGNAHFIVLIPDGLPPLPEDGDTFVTQVSWFWSPRARLPFDPFPTLPLEPAPRSAFDARLINFSDIWWTDFAGVRYSFMGLLAHRPPAFAAQTWTVTVHRIRHTPAGQQDGPQITDIETLQRAMMDMWIHERGERDERDERGGQ